MELLEDNIEKHIDRIAPGLHVDLIETHRFSIIDINIIIFDFDSFYCSSIFSHEPLV